MNFKKLSIILLVLCIGMTESLLYFKPLYFEWFITLLQVLSIVCSFIFGAIIMTEEDDNKITKTKITFPYE